MRAGETDCAETINSKELINYGEKVSNTLKHIANLDVDLFLVKNKPYILEMNARFGGGYPFSHLAGANLPKAIIEWVKNKNIRKEEILNINYGVLGQKDIKIIKL